MAFAAPFIPHCLLLRSNQESNATMKRVIFIGLWMAAASSLSVQGQTLPLTLKEAEQRLDSRNLTLQSEKYNVDKAKTQAMQAKLFDNPTISVEQNVYNRLNGKYFDMGKQGESVIEMEQPLPLAGQRRKRMKLEKTNVALSESQYEETIRSLRSDLRRTFIECHFAVQSLQVYDKEIESLSDLLRAFEVQHEAGNVSLMEVTRLQTLLLSLQKEKKEAEDRCMELQGNLSVMLKLDTEDKPDCLLDESILQGVESKLPTWPELSGMTMQRPDVRMARLGVTSAQANWKLQRSLAAPEFSLKGSYDRAGNFINNYFAVGFSLSVPLFNRNQGNIRAAKFDISQNRLQEEDAVQKAQSELYIAYNQVKKNLALCHSIDKKMDADLAGLIDGACQNLRRRTLSMVEFIDFYQSYKDAFLQMNELKQDAFLAIENLNHTVGKDIINF